MRTTLILIVFAAAAGCGDRGQPEFPDLVPVKGLVTRGGRPVQGGTVRFSPDPLRTDFNTNAVVGDDGTFSLTTVRTTDKTGERRPGAAPGLYKVTFIPRVDDQTLGGNSAIEVPDPVTVHAGGGDLTVELPRK